MSGLFGWWGQVNILANIAIVAGYALVPFTVLRYLPLRRSTLAAGAVFFATCALTHVSMAAVMPYAKWMVVNHVVQGVAVVWFVVGFSRELRQATRHGDRPGRDDSDGTDEDRGES